MFLAVASYPQNPVQKKIVTTTQGSGAPKP